MTLPEPQGRQREVIYLPESGQSVVLGTAGSGKTTMAILRAKYLAELSHRRVLLVTFNRALVTYLNALAAQSGLPREVETRTYHHFARGYLASQGSMGFNSIVGQDRRHALIATAVQESKVEFPGAAILDSPISYFAEEFKWIIGSNITSAAQFVKVRSQSGGSVLHLADCRRILNVLERYRALLYQAGFLYDWDDIAQHVETTFAADAGGRYYGHVVIDEGQDFTPTMLRSLVAAIPPDGSLSFFGDMAQQVYGNRISWRTAGLTPPEVLEFKENYRNTRQIARLGLALTRSPAFTGIADMVEPNHPRADGPQPIVAQFATELLEREFVVKQVKILARQQSVAILLRTRQDESYFLSQLSQFSPQRLHRELDKWSPGGISIGTYHSAKGFEFDAVILPFCNAQTLPDPERILAFSDPSEGIAQEARLFYVALTRAHVRLIITYSGELTNLLPRDPGLFQHIEP